jgi:hypothetical protein
MKLRISLIILLFLIVSADAAAQCSMCKATAQTGNKDGEFVAGGLNDAIIYLMIVPYILLLIFFRKRIIGFVKEIRSMWG